MTWINGPWLAFDSETTGMDVASDRIVTATVITYRPGQDPAVRSWLADPGVPVPAEATAIHGVSDERARAEGKPAADVVADIDATIAATWGPDVPLFGMNVGFDLSLLDAELRRHHQRPLVVAGPVVDSRILDQHCDRYRRGKRTLTDLCALYGVELGEAAHSAEADALAAARVIWMITRRYPELAAMSLPELHDAQLGWHAEHQRSFAAYLRERKAPGIGDPAARADLIARAGDLDAHADEWPIRRGVS